MFSWRYSFEKINSEYKTILKKRQALNSLFNSGRISQSTFELFDREIEEALAEIERQKKVLLERMTVKSKEVEEQIKILERLLANYEIQHVSGEVDDETYQKEIATLSIGLENAKRELNAIKETMDKLVGVSVPKSVETATQQVVETKTVEELDVGKTETSAEPKTEGETQTITETEKVLETTTAEAKTAEGNVEG